MNSNSSSSNSSSSNSSSDDPVKKAGAALAALNAELATIRAEQEKACKERDAIKRSLADAVRKCSHMDSECSRLSRAASAAKVALENAISWSRTETADEEALEKMFDTITTFEQFINWYKRLTAIRGGADPDYVLTECSLFSTILHNCKDLQERVKILSYLVEKGANPMLIPYGEWSAHFAFVWNSCPYTVEKETLAPFLRLIYATFQRALVCFKDVRFKDERNLDEVSTFVSVVTLEILKQAETYTNVFHMSSKWLCPLEIEMRHIFRNMYDQILVAIREHPLKIFEDTIRDLTDPKWDIWKHETLRVSSSSM